MSYSIIFDNNEVVWFKTQAACERPSTLPECNCLYCVDQRILANPDRIISFTPQATTSTPAAEQREQTITYEA